MKSLTVAMLIGTGALMGLIVASPSASAAIYFSDGFETGTGNWVLTGYWHSVDPADPCDVGAYSGTWTLSYHIDATCDYDDGAVNSGTADLASPVDLTTAATARLTFKSWLETETGLLYDVPEVYVSDDGGTTWTFLANMKSEPGFLMATWVHAELDLTPWVGSMVLIRFSFDTNDALANTFRGWFIDDVQVDDDRPAAALEFFTEDFESGSVGWAATGMWREVDDTLDPCVGAPNNYPGAHSPNVAWGYNMVASCDYDSGLPTLGRLDSPPIDLSTATSARLSFWTWFETENQIGFDEMWVRVSDDGWTTWTDLVELTAALYPQQTWQYVELDLLGWIGSTVEVGFYFDSWDPFSNFYEGWYVDDVAVSGVRVTLYSEWQPVAPTPDGVFSPGEHVMNVGVNAVNLGTIPGNPFDAWLIVENDGNFLYVTYDAVGDLTEDPNDQGAFGFDTDRNLAGTGGADDGFFIQGTGLMEHNVYDAAAGNWVTEDACDELFDPIHLGLACTIGFGTSDNDLVNLHRIVEFRIPLALLDVPLPVPDGYMLGAFTTSMGPNWWYGLFDASTVGQVTWPLRYVLVPPLAIFGDIVLAGNHAPVLDWTGEPNYLVDGLDPETGTELDTYTYRIMYMDPDGDQPDPASPVVAIADGGMLIPGAPFTMNFASWVGAPGDYVAGAIYTFDMAPGTLPCGGAYEYQFGANDQWLSTAVTAILPGPTVLCNQAPEAQSLTVDGFAPASPGIGHITTVNPVFAWSYTDPETDPQTDYEVRVGSGPGMSDMWAPGPAGAPGLTDTYAGAALADGTDYWFGVRVMDGIQWSVWNETMFHTNGIPPAPTTPVIPPDMGIVDALSGQTVSWTSGGADPEGDPVTYDWQVSTDPTFTTIDYSGSTAGTTSTGFQTQTTTTYYWRARACDDWGECSAWSSWQFDTTATVNNAPEAGDLTVDGFASGAPGILHILVANPDFTWTYADPESQAQTDYEVRVGTGPGLSDMWAPGPAGGAGLTDTYGGAALADGTDYYFAVRVMDDVQWSPWNETMFHTNGIPPAPTGPVTPPDAGTVDAGAGTTVSWTSGGADPEGDPVTYEWEVATDVAFTTIVANGTTGSTTSDSFTTIISTQYWWRARACDDWGECSAWSNDPPGYWTFTTTAVVNDPPVASSLGVDGFLDGTPGILHIVSATPDLNWSYSDPESAAQAQYDVRVGTASGMSDMWAPGPQAGANTSVAYAGTALVDGTDYYYGVRVFDGVKWSAWVEVMFHQNTPPTAPTLTSPADGATDEPPGTVSLTWSAATDTESDSLTYYWYLSITSDFSILADAASTPGLTVDATTSESTHYYWRVQAWDGWEFGANSTDFDFTTGVLVTTGSVSGRVADAGGGDLQGATVELLDANGTVVDTKTTGANGRFSFTDVPFGTYSVEASKAGYLNSILEDKTVTSARPDLDVGTMTLERAPQGFALLDYWWLLVVMIIIILAVVLLLLMRRRKPAEAPPPEPAAEEFPPPEEMPPPEEFPPPEDLPPPANPDEQGLPPMGIKEDGLPSPPAKPEE